MHDPSPNIAVPASMFGGRNESRFQSFRDWTLVMESSAIGPSPGEGKGKSTGKMIYICCAYLAIINIVTFIVYAWEAKPSRIPFLFIFGLPIIGGSLGAILADYCFETEHRELRAVYSKFIAFAPPILLFVQIATVVAMMGPELVFDMVWNGVVSQGGVVGAVLLLVNAISFVLVAIRKASYYFAPIGHDVIPDAILIPFVLFGTIGAVISKIIFNFKEDWSTTASKGVQNFLYNNGMFVVLVAYLAILVWFFRFR